MDPWLIRDLFAERVMAFVTLGSVSRLGRLETHVVPAKILEVGAAHLAETLRLHGRARSALAGEKAGGERGEGLGFGTGHFKRPY